MSKWSGLLALAVVGFASVGQGSTEAWLGKDNFVSLDLRQNQQRIAISYPGKLSGICGVQVRLSSESLHNDEARKVAEGLVVKDLIGTSPTVISPVLGEKGVRYYVRTQTYLTVISVGTKSGVSLHNFFAALSPQGGLEHGQITKGIVVATACK